VTAFECASGIPAPKSPLETDLICGNVRRSDLYHALRGHTPEDYGEDIVPVCLGQLLPPEDAPGGSLSLLILQMVSANPDARPTARQVVEAVQLWRNSLAVRMDEQRKRRSSVSPKILGRVLKSVLKDIQTLSEETLSRLELHPGTVVFDRRETRNATASSSSASCSIASACVDSLGFPSEGREDEGEGGARGLPEYRLKHPCGVFMKELAGGTASQGDQQGQTDGEQSSSRKAAAARGGGDGETGGDAVEGPLILLEQIRQCRRGVYLSPEEMQAEEEEKEEEGKGEEDCPMTRGGGEGQGSGLDIKRARIFSLGLVALELLCNEAIPLFSRREEREVWINRTLQRLSLGETADAVGVLRKMLHPSPPERSSADQLIRRISTLEEVNRRSNSAANGVSKQLRRVGTAM